MKLYAGIDLHSNNNYLGIIDKKDKRVYKKKLSNTLSLTLPPQGGGGYKVTLWQDHRESTLKGY